MDTLALSPLDLDLVERDLPRAAAVLGESVRNTGFALVDNHGVAEAMIDRVEAAMRATFALPPADKLACHVPGSGGARGYTAFGVEAAKDGATVDLKEFWHVGRELPEGHRFRRFMPPNLWPAEVPQLRDASLGLFAALERAGLRLLRAIAQHLGQPPDFFDDPVRDGNSVLRLLHYPPVAPGAVGVRAAAHEDINVITLLLGAEEAGLELLDREGRWHALTAPPGTLVVNVGDMLQRLTGGALPSTTHRVANPAPDRAGHARLSMPFFLHFRPDYVIRPLNGAAQPPPITAHDYLEERLRDIGLL